MAEPIEPQATSLPGFQRTWLRGKAHTLDPVVQVGQAGVSDAVIAAVVAALNAHELIKVRLNKPTDKKALASALAEASGAHLCGLIGHTVILYRAHPDKPVIRLPQRDE